MLNGLSAQNWRITIPSRLTLMLPFLDKNQQDRHLCLIRIFQWSYSQDLSRGMMETQVTRWTELITVYRWYPEIFFVIESRFQFSDIFNAQTLKKGSDHFLELLLEWRTLNSYRKKLKKWNLLPYLILPLILQLNTTQCMKAKGIVPVFVGRALKLRWRNVWRIKRKVTNANRWKPSQRTAPTVYQVKLYSCNNGPCSKSFWIILKNMSF